jgi:hypothetical protein
LALARFSCQNLQEEGGRDDDITIPQKAFARAGLEPSAHVPARRENGRDLEERERIYGIISNAGRWSFALVVVLGLANVNAMLERIEALMRGLKEVTDNIALS